MRDSLPDIPNDVESGILNLDSIKGDGTHWTCFYKKSNICYYFDSFGTVPPNEFQDYIRTDIIHSTYCIQKLDDIICGHLCLIVLYELLINKLNFHTVIYRLFFLLNK